MCFCLFVPSGKHLFAFMFFFHVFLQRQTSRARSMAILLNDPSIMFLVTLQLFLSLIFWTTVPVTIKKNRDNCDKNEKNKFWCPFTFVVIIYLGSSDWKTTYLSRNVFFWENCWSTGIQICCWFQQFLWELTYHLRIWSISLKLHAILSTHSGIGWLQRFALNSAEIVIEPFFNVGIKGSRCFTEAVEAFEFLVSCEKCDSVVQALVCYL